jgi:hypothetical protein
VKVVVERSVTKRYTERYEVEIEASDYGGAVSIAQHAIEEHFTQFHDTVLHTGVMIRQPVEEEIEPVELVLVDPDEARLIPFPEGGKR